LTVEKFPGVETASTLVNFESVSTKIMATMVQYEKFTTINVLFFSQYFICLDEISSDSSLFKCGQSNTFKSLFIGYMLQSRGRKGMGRGGEGRGKGKGREGKGRVTPPPELADRRQTGGSSFGYNDFGTDRPT